MSWGFHHLIMHKVYYSGQGGSTALRRRMVETDIEHLAVNHFIIQNAKNPGAVGFVGKLLEAFASAGPQWCLLLSTVFEPYK